MKHYILRFSLLIICILLLQNCDPTSVRNCGVFTFDISSWSVDDDTISNSIVFLDEQLNEFEFNLIESSFSEPYEAFEVGASSPDEVGCMLTKSNVYRNDELETDLAFTYTHYEMPSRIWQTVYFNLEIKNSKNDTFIQTKPLYFNNEDLEQQLNVIDEIGFSGQSYSNVIQYEIADMLNSISLQRHTDTIFRSLYFKKPIGLIQIEFSDGTKLIKKE